MDLGLIPAKSSLVEIDGQTINLATLDTAVSHCMDMLARGFGFTLFTLNMDHLVKRRSDAAFRAAYQRATFISADGAPLVWLARRHGVHLERTTGADLLVPLCQAAAEQRVPVAFFGSSLESLERAAARLRQQFPTLDIRHLEAPAQGFDPHSPAAAEAAARIAASGARLCFVALGAPKQEFFSDRMARIHPGIGFLGIGAAIDFVSGAQVRAPKLLQQLNLEWLWRLGTNPRRLLLRYAQCAMTLASVAALNARPKAPPVARVGSLADGDGMHAPYKILLMHPMDPRGGKLGGIETHVRLILSRHPEDFSILFVGVDEFGDCRLGELHKIEVAGRMIDFMPVAKIDATRINLPGRTLLQSTTFRFAAGALRYLARLRKLVKGTSMSADLQRLEFALIPKLLGLRTVQMVHGEGRRDQKMDSLIKKLWFVHRTNEWIALRLADRILCVNDNIIRRFETVLPFAVHKSEMMTVSVDTKHFVPKPFDTTDGIFRIVFAGRLDAFKDPPLMFRSLARLHEKLGGKVEFHYLGTTDPHRYADFEAIESFTVRHGFQSADGVANVLEACHAGILTSHFEGMPCYLLETLSTGRPFAAIRLPQYDPLVVRGISGALVERTDPDEVCCGELADAFVQIWNDIRAGQIDPEAVHRLVEPYSIETQMARLFAHHRSLQSSDGTRSMRDLRRLTSEAEA